MNNMGNAMNTSLSDLASHMVRFSQKEGATATEIVIREGNGLSVKVRLGKTESVEESNDRALGIRVFCDQKCAVSYTSDLRKPQLESFVKKTIEVAQFSEKDKFNTLPDADEYATTYPDLDLYDDQTNDVTASYALNKAKEAEEAALTYSDKITNSSGATWSSVVMKSMFASSNDFAGEYRGSYSSLYVEPIADDADGKKRNDYWWTANRFLSELDDPKIVGVEAAKRTVSQLGAKKVKTGSFPVVFDTESGRSIVGTLAGIANGAAFYRNASYLIGREQTKVASDLVTISDEPRHPRWPGSRPFDGDGLPTRDNIIVNEGVLETVLCDVYSARKLNRRSTGSASRSTGGLPSPSTSNLIMKPRDMSPNDIIAQTKQGLYVTGMMGFGFNPITGDFSRGAFGFWIEDGKLTFPVTEVTISANLNDLMSRIDMVGNDLDQRASTMTPTFRVSEMTIAGL